jgi:hypothetical protein
MLSTSHVIQYSLLITTTIIIIIVRIVCIVVRICCGCSKLEHVSVKEDLVPCTKASTF